MASYIHTGVPGSGKTYLMVLKFIELFCKYDKEEQMFFLKPKYKDKLIVSNIEGLAIEHIDLETMFHDRCLTLARKKFVDNIGSSGVEDMDDVIEEYYQEFYSQKIRWFFNYPYQKQLQQIYGNVIYLIEESQRYFDSKRLGREKWLPDLFYFFEKHRHLGCSILMDTQHVSKIHKGISVLFETETRAKPRTFSVMGEFKYNEYSEGAKMNPLPIVKKPDKKVYAAYKSAHATEDLRTKKPIFKIVAFVCIMVILSYFVFNFAKNSLGPEKAIAAETPKTVNHKIVTERGSSNVLSNISQPIEKHYHWQRLSFVHTSGTNFTIVHPVTNVIMDLKELDLEVKRQGSSLLVKIPDDY